MSTERHSGELRRTSEPRPRSNVNATPCTPRTSLSGIEQSRRTNSQAWPLRFYDYRQIVKPSASGPVPKDEAEPEALCLLGSESKPRLTIARTLNRFAFTAAKPGYMTVVCLLNHRYS